jgi:hypothetical protein
VRQIRAGKPSSSVCKGLTVLDYAEYPFATGVEQGYRLSYCENPSLTLYVKTDHVQINWNDDVISERDATTAATTSSPPIPREHTQASQVQPVKRRAQDSSLGEDDNDVDAQENRQHSHSKKAELGSLVSVDERFIDDTSNIAADILHDGVIRGTITQISHIMRHGRRRPVATITVNDIIKVSTALCHCRVADVPIIATTARILDLGTTSKLDSDDSDSSHGDDDETLVNQSTTQGARSGSFGV